MNKAIAITDSIGNVHIVSIEPNGDAGEFKLVCTNSGEELARGEETTGANDRRLVEIFAADPIFADHGLLEFQVEEQFNETWQVDREAA